MNTVYILTFVSEVDEQDTLRRDFGRMLGKIKRITKEERYLRNEVSWGKIIYGGELGDLWHTVEQRSEVASRDTDWGIKKAFGGFFLIKKFCVLIICFGLNGGITIE